MATLAQQFYCDPIKVSHASTHLKASQFAQHLDPLLLEGMKEDYVRRVTWRLLTLDDLLHKEVYYLRSDIKQHAAFSVWTLLKNANIPANLSAVAEEIRSNPFPLHPLQEQ